MLIYAVDLGTTNLKVALYDECLRRLALSSKAVSYDTLHRRPVVSRAAKARMLARALLLRLRLVFRPVPVDDARKTTLAKRHA